jgi:LuxR family transcriptional regulator, maltose regulon positive regulatory protein
LRTTILKQLSGQLCDAVTGDGASTSILERLDRSNLFVVPLDDRRQWYRYHRLFADVLRAYLEEEHSDQIPDLYHRGERVVRAARGAR